MTERPSEEHTNHVVIQREAEIGRGNAFRWASLAKEDLLPAKQSLEIGVGERGTPEVTFPPIKDPHGSPSRSLESNLVPHCMK